MFRRFWSAAGGVDNRMTPIGAWTATSTLGTHSPGADQLVLLVRGGLLRRFPSAVIYLSGRGRDGSEPVLVPNVFAAAGLGALFVGFPITPEEALTPSDPGPSAATAWSIVIQESVDHARFGLDETASDNPDPGWQDLDRSDAQVKDKLHVPVAGPLAGVTRPLTTTGNQVVDVPSATWGVDAGRMAAILARPAFRVRIPLQLWLSPTPNPSR
jgi:hypothetical protein